MATQIKVQTSSAQHAMSLAPADDRVAEVIPDAEFYKIIWRCRDAERAVSRRSLLEATSSLLRDLQQQWDVLPYHYSTRGHIQGREDLPFGGSGGVSGFRINGQINSIWGGAGQCYLQQMEVGPDGMGRIVRVVDVRHQKRVETDDWGPIKISRRKLEMTLPEQLQSLISFLRRIPDDEVQVLTTDGTQSVMELVRLASEGEEGAEEELFNRGESAMEELRRRITESKVRKHHGTIAWLLLTLFPSVESRKAVEHLAAREREPERKKTYLALLASTGG